MTKLIIIVVLAVIIGLPIVAGQLLPWWGALLVLGAEIVAILSAGPRLIAFVIKRHLVGVFSRNSRVLKNADVVVHSITDQAMVAEEGEPVRHILLDFTLTPHAQAGPSDATLYDPLELMLVPADAVVSMDEDPIDEEACAMATQVRLVDEKGEESDCDKLTGSVHLRIMFALGPRLSGRAKFRYYFEQFGEVILP